MSRSSSGFVAGLTAAALAAVGFLAYQASASAPDDLGKHAGKRLPLGHRAALPQGARRTRRRCPAQSGTGERVVYSVSEDRVWLVGGSGEAAAHVQGHAEHGRPGARHLQGRLPLGLRHGTDGVAIEHVVRFATVGRDHDRLQRGGGRLDRRSRTRRRDRRHPRVAGAHGNAMWEFATIGQQGRRRSLTGVIRLTGGRDDRAAPSAVEPSYPAAVVSSPEERARRRGDRAGRGAGRQQIAHGQLRGSGAPEGPGSPGDRGCASRSEADMDASWALRGQTWLGRPNQCRYPCDHARRAPRNILPTPCRKVRANDEGGRALPDAARSGIRAAVSTTRPQAASDSRSASAHRCPDPGAASPRVPRPWCRPTARSMTTCSRSSESSSTLPSPHSTTITDSGSETSRSRSSISSSPPPRRYASTCTRGGPSESERMDAGDDEGRRGDGAAHAEALAEAAGERRLACAELAGEHARGRRGAAAWPGGGPGRPSVRGR